MRRGGSARAEATDAELLELFAKMIKQREKSEKIYTQAGRAELAKQEAEEIAIIREFLPEAAVRGRHAEGHRRGRSPRPAPRASRTWAR